MASQPHDASGKQCGVCHHTFTPASMTLSINKKEMINDMRHVTRVRVCGKCYDAHYSKEE